MDTEYEEREYYPPQPVLRANRRPAIQPIPRTTGTANQRKHWALVPIGIGMLIVVGVLLIAQRVVIPAADWTNDQWYYGDSRLTQLDADVGHGGTSHFIAGYCKAGIVVAEVPYGRPANSRVYVLGGFTGGEMVPVVSLSVQDLNGDGKPDLLVGVEGTAVQAALFNTGAAFSTRGS
jgi:hypothetical protein